MLTLLTVVLAQAIPSGHLERAEVWFDARATVADFQGRATTVTGELIGGATPADGRGWIEVHWADIDTKNGTRNRHMLKTVEAGQFRVIRFEVTSVRPGLDSVTGTLALHGVTKDVVWPVSVQVGDDSVSVAADFAVDMRDYGIKPPVRFLIARMGAVVQVHVRLVFRKNQTRG